MNNENLSRRVFLKMNVLAGLSLATTALLGGSQISKEYAPQFLAEIPHYEVLPSQQKSPIAKGGIGYNAVFLPYRDEKIQEDTLDFAVKNGATFLRVFFDYPEADFEPTLGHYRQDVLDQFSTFCVKAADRNLSLIVALSDGYRMGACLEPNPIYGSKNVLGPYYQPDANNDPWMPFYTDPPLVKAFEKRTKRVANAVTSSLKPYLDLNRIQLFFEPMNEPRIPKGKDGKTLFNQWLLSISGMLKTVYKIPCISGVADPKTVNIPLINTLHYYPNLFNKQEQLSSLMNQPHNNLPVFIEETGINDDAFGMHDQRLSEFLSDIFLRTTKIDFIHKTIQPLISPLLCLWHIDLGNYDHYNITDQVPDSLELIRNLSTIYQKAATP